MKQLLVPVLAVGLLLSAGEAHAQYEEYAEEERDGPIGFIGALLGAGFALNGQFSSGLSTHFDTSLVFGLRGGLLVGDDHRGLVGFELAPATNKIDWRLRPTTSFITTFGTLITLRKPDRFWVWRVGVGVGGGLDYKFLLAFQADLLSFHFRMNKRITVDIGVPSVRFYTETVSQARWAVQFVFPLGFTWDFAR